MELDVSHFNARKTKWFFFFFLSTIGNQRQDAEKLLKSTREIGEIGVMLSLVETSQKILKFLKNYDDRKGVTSAFNKNLLNRVNKGISL